jgi:Na+-transporting NADH:ubiquinone oxidoreductase subunit B
MTETTGIPDTHRNTRAMNAEPQGKAASSEDRQPGKWFLFQPMMMKVVLGLTPCLIGSVYFFGLRALTLTALVLVFGIAAEGAFTYPRGKPVTSAVFVTSLIFSLSLPPTIPYWMAVVGIVFAVVFGKMVFGGFGYNVYNPAMVGRCFIYIAFPIALTNQWIEPFSLGVAGFQGWSPPPVDAVTTATPLEILRAGNDVPLGSLFWGNVSGSLGETSALLVILGGLFIVVTKAAPWRMALSCLAGGLALSTILNALGVFGVPDPFTFLMAGSFLFGTFFVVTEPVSGPKTKAAQWIYGFLVGALIIILRRYSNFSEGVMFAVLFMNTFVSVMDLAVKSLKKKKSAETP